MVKLFVTILLFSAFAVQAATSGDWVFDLITSTDSGVPNEVAIIGYTGSRGPVSIPASINEIPVTRIGLPIIPETDIGAGDTISTFTIPDSETGIEGSAFSTSAGVTSISIPSTITEIGRRAFFSCSDLTSIDVAPDNPYYSSQEGVLYNKNKTTLVAFPSGKAGTFSIPSSVTSINNEAFKGCSKLTAITIPDSVTSIGYEAFAYCSSLTSITLPNNVSTIQYGTFARCTALSSVTLPKNIGAIWRHAFLDCIRLTDITFPQSLSIFDGNSFRGCTTLSKAYFLGSFPSFLVMSIPDAFIQIVTTQFGFTDVNLSMGFSRSTTIKYRFGATGWNDYIPGVTPIELLPPNIKNLSFVVVGGITKIRLTFETFPEWQYEVQKSSDLLSWSTVATFSGDGSDKAFEEKTADRAFYRIYLYWVPYN
jgi:BspA type Leucine rich repeat region (6 copies)